MLEIQLAPRRRNSDPEANNDPLLLLGFKGIERYSLPRTMCQFGWTGSTQSMIDYTNAPLDPT